MYGLTNSSCLASARPVSSLISFSFLACRRRCRQRDCCSQHCIPTPRHPHFVLPQRVCHQKKTGLLSLCSGAELEQVVAVQALGTVSCLTNLGASTIPTLNTKKTRTCGCARVNTPSVFHSPQGSFTINSYREHHCGHHACHGENMACASKMPECFQASLSRGHAFSPGLALRRCVLDTHDLENFNAIRCGEDHCVHQAWLDDIVDLHIKGFGHFQHAKQKRCHVRSSYGASRGLSSLSQGSGARLIGVGNCRPMDTTCFLPTAGCEVVLMREFHCSLRHVPSC